MIYIVEDDVPDLFILDIMLPGEDGLSILKRLRAQESTKNVPIIMLTAVTRRACTTWTW